MPRAVTLIPPLATTLPPHVAALAVTLLAALDQEVHLQAVLSAEVKRFDGFAASLAGSENLLDHPAFPTRAHTGLRPQVGFGYMAQKGVQQAGITPVDFWRFDEPLAEVGVERRQPTDEQRRLQVIQVGLNRVIADAKALAELRCVEDAALLGSHHAKETIRHGRLRRKPASRGRSD